MKKADKYFALVDLVVFLVFNLIVFLIPSEIMGVERFKQPAFWVGYAFVVVSMLLQLLVSFIFGKSKKVDEAMFLRLPLLHVQYIAMALSVVVGLVFLIVPVLPAWLGGIICILLTAIIIFAFFKAKATGDIISGVDKKIALKTQFVTLSRTQLEMLINSADARLVPKLKETLEVVRYSDPMSNQQLLSIENQITNEINSLKTYVEENDFDKANASMDNIQSLMKNRNVICKACK